MARDFKFFIDSSAISSGPLTKRVFATVHDDHPYLETASGERVFFSDLAEREKAEVLELMGKSNDAWARHAIVAREFSEWRKAVGI